MKKLTLSVIGMFVGMLAAFSQQADTAVYKSRKLHADEINFVSGYYHQDGDHSAVTGGIGTEKLSDLANTLELKLSAYDKRARKHSLSLQMGVDHYSSASSDKIDPHTISSASSADTRLYPSVSWTVQNEARHTTFGLNTSVSSEFDYRSFGIGGSFTKSSRDNNFEFSSHVQAYLDHWSVILPIELRTDPGRDDHDYPKQPRNSFSASLSVARVINQNLQVSLVVEPTYQSGLLATKYQRVYFTDGSERSENLPDRRFKLPLGLRANYFISDRFILRAYYRYYQDDWGVRAHTAELELPVKISPFFSVSPFYRWYTQTAADQFASYGVHAPSETYFTSDYDLSQFSSRYFGGNLRLSPPKGVFGWQQLSSLELRYGRYLRDDGLHANQATISLQWKL